MLQWPQRNNLWPTRCLRVVNSAPPLHLDPLHRLLPLGTLRRRGQKLNPARTSALLWPQPCCSSSLSRTQKRHPLRKPKTLHWLWMLQPGDSHLHHGLLTLHRNLQLQSRRQVDQTLPLPWPQNSSRKTKTSVFPMEQPTDPQSTGEVKFGIMGHLQQPRPEGKGSWRMHTQKVTHWTSDR